MTIEIRAARPGELKDIVEIYNQAVLTKSSTADLEPIEIKDRREWFDNHPEDSYPVYVALEEGRVVGWLSLSPYRPGRMALRYTVEVSYYVHEQFQGRGVGSRLLDYGIKRAGDLGYKTLFAIILEKNSSSVKFVERFDFSRWGYLPGVAEFDGEETGHLYYGLRLDSTS